MLHSSARNQRSDQHEELACGSATPAESTTQGAEITTNLNQIML